MTHLKKVISEINLDNTGILLIGYNRPELILNRLFELYQQGIKHLYLNIDGGSKSNTKEMNEVISQAYLLFSNQVLKVNHQKKNLGMAIHVTESITNLFHFHKNLIIIEDDVKLSRNFIENLISGLNFQTSLGLSGIITGNSNLFCKFKQNKWRTVDAPSVWGWAITSKTWNLYNLFLRKGDIEKDMANSDMFRNLSKYYKNYWRTKFYKSADFPFYNWDTQLRYMLFKENLKSLAPVFSITGNEGFSKSNAVHTNYSIPRNIKNDELNVTKINGLSKISPLYEYFTISAFKHRLKKFC
jgi:hypothetical protein